MDQEVRRNAQKAGEKVSNGLEVAVCATRLNVVEFKCSLKSVMRGKSCKNMFNFFLKNSSLQV